MLKEKPEFVCPGDAEVYIILCLEPKLPLQEKIWSKTRSHCYMASLEFLVGYRYVEPLD
jgi:hypothetical protein